jgi:hypothetical protein
MSFRPRRTVADVPAHAGVPGAHSGGEEAYVFATRRIRRANGSTIDTGRADTDEEAAIETRVARKSRPLQHLIVVDRRNFHDSKYTPGTNVFWPESDLDKK